MTAGRGQATRAPLSVELACAARAIHALAAGTALPAALAASVPNDLPDASRAACRDIASRTVRLLGTVGALSRRLNARPPAPALQALQHVALAQLIDPVRAGHVTVDQSVRAAKSDPVLRAASGFLNATLRRFLREREALMHSLDGDDEAKYNFPAWWIQRLRAEQPARWRGILETLNRPAPMTLRVNVSRVSVADYLERLDVEGIAARRVGACALVLARAVAVETLPGWHDGHVSVQDTAAQLAAPLLDVGDGMRVLDACAAPGGKTNHLLERHDCELLALDADPARLARVHENLERLGQQARVLAGDAARPQDWWDGRQFDRILLDAPCSASGIVRRQPDVRWLRRAQDPDALGARQQRLLESLWALLRPGGKLLFCTCSIFRAEGEDVVGRFLAAQGDAVGVSLSISLPPEAPPEPLALLLPRADDACDHDGFYFALIEKRP
ncbi:MAG: 16S rRNA (cytosine(967)-C(5))-methyltransferase RsmB [Burkholderiaceae bacterium]